MKKILAGLLCLFLFSFCQAQHRYGLLKKFSIASGGGWDYIAVNEGKLYVSHGTQVNMLDEATGDSVGIIPNTRGVHGIAFDTALHKGFTSNGRSNNVTVFDLKTTTVLDSIATGKNPDAILYEPFTKTIITCNGGSNDLTVIDPKTGNVTHTIAVGGKPETAVSNGNGILFVNVEDKNEIAVVDLKTFQTTAHWPLHAEGPTGLAIDTKRARLFAGCDNTLVVLDAATGKRIDALPIGEGCDGVVFDEKEGLIFTANGEGTITVIQEQGANNFNVVDTIVTKRGARTLAIDNRTGTLFLPTADFEKTTTTTGRPKMIPGTFQVLVVR